MNRVFKAPKDIPTSGFERLTTASVATTSLMSRSSFSVNSNIWELLDRDILRFKVESLPRLYNLERLGVISTAGSYYKTENSVCAYVQTKLSKLISVSMSVSKGILHLLPSVSTIPTVEKIFPDGTINILDEKKCLVTILMWEVNSGKSWWETTLKLAVQLSKMLASLRNRVGCSEVCSLSGFYFPSAVDTEYVIKVTVEWDNQQMMFIETHHGIQNPDDVPIELEKVFKRNKRLWCDSSVQNVEHNYPVSPSYIKQHFGEDAQQISSGQSVVIKNAKIVENVEVTEKRFVFKYPLIHKEQNRLGTFLSPSFSHAQIGFPHGSTDIDGIVFFRYETYIPPLQRNFIQQHPGWFVTSLVRAIVALHSFGIAHLDIRRENICVGNNNELVLIDLDRSLKLNKRAFGIVQRYQTDRIVQKCPTDVAIRAGADIAENLDWKCLGLFLQSLWCENDFFSSLIDTGQLNKFKFDAWCAGLLH